MMKKKTKEQKEEEWEKERLRLHDLSARCSVLCHDLGEAGLYDSCERMDAVVNVIQTEVALRLTEKKTGKRNPEGWVWMVNNSDYHYFKNGKSLCGRYVIPTSPKFAIREIDRAYNCQICVALLRASGARRR